MKKTSKPLFSNGSEFSMWEQINCQNCWKSGNESRKTMCSIYRDIEHQLMGEMLVNINSYIITKELKACPNKEEQRKSYPRKKVYNHPKLF